MHFPPRSPGSRRPRSLAMLALALTAAACSKPPQRPPAPPVTVAVAIARRADVPYIVEANGVVTPIQSAAVVPQVQGVVTQVAFREGQEVRKGQLLYQVDPEPYRNAYHQALAAYARDSAVAANALAQRDRYRKLVAANVITPVEAEGYETAAATASATVRSDAAALATARFNLDNTSIRAPIAGKTGVALARLGNLVRMGGDPLVVINQTRPILVRFSVPSAELPKLLHFAPNGGLPVTAVPGGGSIAAPSLDSASRGVGAEGSPLSDALVAQGGGLVTPEHGVLTFIDNAVDTSTGTVQLRATFDNKDGDLWVGQFAAMRMRLYVEKNALVVPSQAVVSGQKGTYVYTVDGDGKAQQHAVVVERTASDLSVISAGIGDGDRVVTEGQSRLTPGATVAVRAPDGGPGAAAGAGRR